MSSFSVSDERMLSLITEQLNNVLDRVFITVNDAEAVGVCGFPCMGDCRTCTQSNADLDAFYGIAVAEPAAAPIVEPVSASVEGSGPSDAEEPVEAQQMAYAGDESQNSALEVARAMDALEEAQQNGEAYEYDEDYYDERDDYDDRYDDGYGLDWNESGYFD